jgi:hypothetical protein
MAISSSVKTPMTWANNYRSKKVRRTGIIRERKTRRNPLITEFLWLMMKNQ